MSNHERVLCFWLWCAKNFGWTEKQINETSLSFILDLYVLQDKIDNPNDYIPVESFL